MPRRDAYSDEDVARLKRDYRTYVDSGRLNDLAVDLGRTKISLCEKAKSLGLTDSLAARRRAAHISGDRSRGKPSMRPHPKGMLGKKHTADTKAVLQEKGRAFRASLSPDAASDIALKMLKTRVANGSVRESTRGSWKSGWRVIGTVRKFYRSRWEANYARYLNWLQHRGDILDWKHEPETFWFDGIKRGVRSYLPDFRVWELDGSSRLHEVKGWMDARSRTTLRRMAKYYPDQKIVLIAEKQYKEIERRLGSLIEGWE